MNAARVSLPIFILALVATCNLGAPRRACADTAPLKVIASWRVHHNFFNADEQYTLYAGKGLLVVKDHWLRFFKPGAPDTITQSVAFNAIRGFRLVQSGMEIELEMGEKYLKLYVETAPRAVTQTWGDVNHYRELDMEFNQTDRALRKNIVAKLRRLAGRKIPTLRESRYPHVALAHAHHPIDSKLVGESAILPTPRNVLKGH